MKRNKELERKKLFDSIIMNHYNGNGEDAKEQLNKLSKLNLVRFINHLQRFSPLGSTYYYVDINGKGELDLFIL
jgi:hypothetical protein